MGDMRYAGGGTSSTSFVTPLSAWLIAGAALFSAAILIWTIGDALGISADSTQYLSAADNVASGNGLKAPLWSGRSGPLTHFPPLYPVLLALLTRWVGDVPQAAYMMNVMLAPVNVLLLAKLAARTMRGMGDEFSMLAAAVAAVCGSVSSQLLLVHAMVWSEPLFISLLLPSLIGLLAILENPRALAWYFVVIGAAAAAALARFTGLALIGALGLATALLQRSSLRQRLGTAALIMLTSILPVALLLIRTSLQGALTANREIAVHLIQRRDIAYGLSTILASAVPSIPYPKIYAALVGLYVIAFVSLLLAGVRARWSMTTPFALDAPDSPIRPTIALGIFVASYVAFVVVSISFADRSTMLDKRILTPALVVTLAIVACLGVCWLAVAGTFTATRRVFTRGALATLLISYVAAQSFGLVDWFTRVRTKGIGFAQIGRYAPALVDRMRRLPPSAALYSNNPYVVHFFTGRTVAGLPFRWSPTSLKPNPALPEDLTAMRDVATENGVYLIEVGQRQSYLVRDSTLLKYVDIDSVEVLPGGRIQFLRRIPDPNADQSREK
jgi:hypothetical protein